MSGLLFIVNVFSHVGEGDVYAATFQMYMSVKGRVSDSSAQGV